MNKRLEELRDKVADEYGEREKKYPKLFPRDDFNAGFNAAIAELMPRVERLVEALEKRGQCNHPAISGPHEGILCVKCDVLTEWREFIGAETLTRRNKMSESKAPKKQYLVWQGYDNEDEQYFNYYDTLNDAVTCESGDAEDGEVEVFEANIKLLGIYKSKSVVVKKKAKK